MPEAADPPPVKTSVRRLVEVVRASGDTFILQYYDLNGRLLFTLPEEVDGQGNPIQIQAAFK